MKIVIGFSKRKKFNLISKSICLIQGTPYSHVYVKFYSKNLDRHIIYEASGSSIHFKSEILFNEQNEIIEEIEVEIDDSAYINSMRFCVDNAGKSYGTLSMLGLGYSIIMSRITGKEVKNPFVDGDKTAVCSEVAARLLQVSGLTGIPDVDQITPLKLYNYLKSTKINN